LWWKLDSGKLVRVLLILSSNLIIVQIWISSSVRIPIIINTWQVLKTISRHKLLRLVIQQIIGLLRARLTLPARILYLPRSKRIFSISSISELKRNIDVIYGIGKTLFRTIIDKWLRFVALIFDVFRNLSLKSLIVRRHLILRKRVLSKVHYLLCYLLLVFNRWSTFLAW
jgi:hypothetical protein